MEAQTGKAGSKKSDPASLKLRVVEYLVAQYDCGDSTDIRSILNETKVGAWRRPTLQQVLNRVFTTN